jgi:photosystem II stability/assembly factor-like uncharacterized protein
LSLAVLSQEAAKPAPKKPAPAAQTSQKPEAAKPAAATPAKEAEKPAEAKPAEPQAPAGGEQEGGPGGPGRGPRDPMSTPTFNGLRLRSIGPALTSGRVSSLAVDPKNTAYYFVGAASGGVWKTTNNGATFTPVFDNQGSYSIGAVALDPKDPAVVWVGTGEGNSQRSVSYGDGVYKSEDAGRSWRNVGLKKSEHIHRIVIDPRDSKVVYVAAQGPLWGPGGDRGLFKTTDGGKSWKSVLPNVSENTGVTDVVLDPENPDLIYAATYQRRRHVFTLLDGGPESAIYKSTDAGATWTRLRSGLPTGDMGRIGLAVAPTDPKVVYAIIEAAESRGGVFRSDDHGATWQRRNPYEDQGQYYGQIFVDPKNEDRVYVLNVQIMLSEDGGRTLRAMQTRAKHVDNHAWWIDPNNNDHYLNGNDGGLYESWDRGVNWTFKQNLPITQFYDVAVDMGKPYYVYGGTQDNNSLGGPSRTRGMTGPMNSDWFVTAGGDGFDTEVDPEDANTVYSESQYGGLVRFDRRTGTGVDIQPQELKDDPANRWNWDSPIVLSPHAHTRLYFASQKVYRSDDRGNSWKAISSDLTRQIDRNKLPVMGKVWGPDAVAKNVSTSFYGNIVSLEESPKKEGLIYVGTDDGLIQITENGGQSWTKYDKFPGVPENTYVSRIKASPHDANLVFAAFDNHKNADFKPYLLKSTDAGKSWTSIASNLPENGPVLAFAQDPVNKDLLFAGTEFGVFFSINGGQKWIQLKGSMPTIAVRDIVVHPREGDLVLATFGRGFYILDDITPLRVLKPEMFNQAGTIFPVKTAVMYAPSRTQSRNGSDHYAAENPPYGAVITYFVKDRLQTKKELRQQAERAAERRGEPIPYPTKDELRAEAEEEAPQLFAMLYDAQGTPIRRLNLPSGQGIQRVAWDLRYPAPNPVQVSAAAGGGRGGFGGAGGGAPEEPPPEFAMFRQAGGPLVMSGQYAVKIFKTQNEKTTEVAGPQSFTVVADNEDQIKPEDRVVIAAFQKRVANLYRAVSGTLRATDDLQNRLAAIKRALQETPAADPKFAQQAEEMEAKLRLILRNLRGDQIIAARNYEVPPSINERVSNVMGNTRFSINPPRQADVDNLSLAASLFTAELAKVRALVETDLPKLEKGLDASGAPWTPGRLPEFVDKP